jgi:hypothetical protein
VSLYTPSLVGIEELDILHAPYLGGEWEVYFSHTAAIYLGGIEMSGVAVGTYTDAAATALTGDDVQVVCRTPLLSDSVTVITFSTLNNAGTPAVMNGVATFEAPAWVADQGHNFPRGYAVDMVPGEPGFNYTAITALASISGGQKSVEFDLFVLPALTSYVMIGCTNNPDFGLKSRTALGINCGSQTDEYVKRGMTTPGTLSMGASFKGVAAGMSRFAGSKVTAMLLGKKDGQVTGERYVFTGFVPGVSFSMGDGDAVSSETCDGKFEEVLVFSAPFDATVAVEQAGAGIFALADDGAGNFTVMEGDDGFGGPMVLEFDN